MSEATTLLCKLSVPPTRLPSLIESLEATAAPPRVLALPTVGVCYAAWLDASQAAATVERLTALATEATGSLVVERCPLDLKRAIDVFGAPPPSFALMRRLKEELDPKGVLSPGRFLGRL
jgi:glycolate oxidase FAD binding subunit